MDRRLLAGVALLMLVVGCAGPNKLADKSQSKLAEGDMWKAWKLATQALDRQPANVRARAAADAAASTIAADWRRRIQALAASDSLEAAEQVLQFVDFRTNAARYVTVGVTPTWAQSEHALRLGAARSYYQRATEELKAKRPKRAYGHFLDAERFFPGYRDAARLADRAYQRALSHVAVMPLRTRSGRLGLGREVAETWRAELAGHSSSQKLRYTRILPGESVEQEIRVTDVGRLGRADAVALAKNAGAERVVWGTIGETRSKSRIETFSETVVRRMVIKNPDGTSTTRWVEVPIQVIARTRTVDVDLDYELMTANGGTLTRRKDVRTMNARVLWTAMTPVGAPDTYALYSEEARSADPERCKRIETRWKAVVGDGTTLSQVLEAKRSSPRETDPAQAMARIVAGAAVVLLEGLPSADELAVAALNASWKTVYNDLVTFDAVDDIDVEAPAASAEDR
jgi:hypothetical protein